MRSCLLEKAISTKNKKNRHLFRNGGHHLFKDIRYRPAHLSKKHSRINHRNKNGHRKVAAYFTLHAPKTILGYGFGHYLDSFAREGHAKYKYLRNISLLGFLIITEIDRLF